ncbi:MAG: hypothetical protein K1X83_01070 [Oligoflexia bacterium]|nr:hypothetical protein [Oligoflexia bacterium]
MFSFKKRSMSCLIAIVGVSAVFSAVNSFAVDPLQYDCAFQISAQDQQTPCSNASISGDTYASFDVAIESFVGSKGHRGYELNENAIYAEVLSSGNACASARTSESVKRVVVDRKPTKVTLRRIGNGKALLRLIKPLDESVAADLIKTRSELGFSGCSSCRERIRGTCTLRVSP